MSEAGGHPKRHGVCSTQFHGCMSSKRGRVRPDIDHDVENRTRHAAYQFALRWAPLEVQPPDNASLRTALNRLLEICGDTLCGEV